MIEELRRTLWPHGNSGDIWAVVDAAQDQRVYWTMTNSFLQHSCLFAGPLPPALEMAAPYLVQLDPEDKFTEYLAENMGKNLGIFLRTDLGMKDLRRHLRTFLSVKDPAGRKLLFRYYDPRVMRVYLPTCNFRELETVFGPIRTFWTESADPRSLTQFEMKKNSLKVEARVLGTPVKAEDGGGDGLAPEIVLAQNVLVVQKPGERHRVPILIQGAGSGGRLLRSANNVRVYRSAIAAEELPVQDGAYVVPSSNLDPDLTVYADATAPGEVTLTFDAARGGKTEATLTAVNLRLDSGAGDVCVGVGGSRRRITVLPIEPASCKARLTLRTAPGGPALHLFADESTISGHALADGYSFDAPEAPVHFWVEASKGSARTGDIALQLLAEGGNAVGDHRPVTAVAFEGFTASIPSTPSRTNRLPVKKTADSLQAREIVLLAGAADGDAPIRLEAATVPAGAGLHWTVERAGDDSDAIRALSARPVPTMKPDGRGVELASDAAGTFRVKVTAGGESGLGGPAAEFQVVLVHAAVSENRSAVNGRFCACARVAGTDRFSLDSGKAAAVRLEASVHLTGGGPDSMRGVDAIRGGWIHNLLSDNTGARYKGGAAAATVYNFQSGAEAATVDFEGGPLLDAPRGSRCLAGSELAAAPDSADLDFRAQLAPAAQWKVNFKGAPDKPIEQIWSYREGRAYLTMWSTDAPGQLGVLLQTGWSFTGDYACTPMKTVRPIVAARLAATRTSVFPAVTPAARIEMEVHPPVSGESIVEES